MRAVRPPTDRATSTPGVIVFTQGDCAEAEARPTATRSAVVYMVVVERGMLATYKSLRGNGVVREETEKRKEEREGKIKPRMVCK